MVQLRFVVCSYANYSHKFCKLHSVRNEVTSNCPISCLHLDTWCIITWLHVVDYEGSWSVPAWSSVVYTRWPDGFTWCERISMHLGKRLLWLQVYAVLGNTLWASLRWEIQCSKCHRQRLTLSSTNVARTLHWVHKADTARFFLHFFMSSVTFA